MSGYIDVVLCRTDEGRKLFVAPAWSDLDAGTRVTYLSDGEKQNAEVICSRTVDMNYTETSNKTGEFDFICKLMGVNTICRLLSRVRETEFDYEDD